MVWADSDETASSVEVPVVIAGVAVEDIAADAAGIFPAEEFDDDIEIVDEMEWGGFRDVVRD